MRRSTVWSIPLLMVCVPVVASFTKARDGVHPPLSSTRSSSSRYEYDAIPAPATSGRRVILQHARRLGLLYRRAQNPRVDPNGLREHWSEAVYKWPWNLPVVQEEFESRLNTLRQRIPLAEITQQLRAERDRARSLIVDEEILEQLEFITPGREQIEHDKYEIDDPALDDFDVYENGGWLKAPKGIVSTDYDLVIVVKGQAHYDSIWHFPGTDTTPVVVRVLGTETRDRDHLLQALYPRAMGTRVYGSGKLYKSLFPPLTVQDRLALVDQLVKQTYAHDSLIRGGLTRPDKLWKYLIASYLIARPLGSEAHFGPFDKLLFGMPFQDWFPLHYLHQSPYPWSVEGWESWSMKFTHELTLVMIPIDEQFSRAVVTPAPRRPTRTVSPLATSA